MEEQFKLIEGTLARTKERKNTILYKQAKIADERNRLLKLGITEIPTNPLEVNDVKVVKFILFKIKQQLGEKKVLISNEEKMSISKVGEAQLRAANNSINKLLRKQCEWEKRMNELLGKSTPEDYSLWSQKFFGCARSLPEAQKVATENNHVALNERNKYPESNFENTESDDDCFQESSISDIPNELKSNSEYCSMISSLLAGDECVLKAEKEAEKRFRKSLSSPPQRMKLESEVILNFEEGNKIPSEDYFKNRLMEKRKESLKARLACLKS